VERLEFWNSYLDIFSLLYELDGLSSRHKHYLVFALTFIFMWMLLIGKLGILISDWRLTMLIKYVFSSGLSKRTISTYWGPVSSKEKLFLANARMMFIKTVLRLSDLVAKVSRDADDEKARPLPFFIDQRLVVYLYSRRFWMDRWNFNGSSGSV